MHIVMGLGNPGKEYENTRHNAGRMVVERLHATHNFSEWNKNSKPAMLTSLGALSGAKTTLVLPDTFMNRSGSAAGHYIKNKKGAGNLIVIQDELDMPLGSMKIVYGRSSGGHNGVESVIKALKTNEFVRIRIGVSKKSAQGVALKPKGESKVVKFILAKFTPAEDAILKKVMKQAVEAVEVIVKDGRQAAMNQFN